MGRHAIIRLAIELGIKVVRIGTLIIINDSAQRSSAPPRWRNRENGLISRCVRTWYKLRQTANKQHADTETAVYLW
jgi:hypothetical protein